MVPPLNAQTLNRTKAYTLAWYGYPKRDGLTKRDKVQDKMKIDTKSVRPRLITHSYIIDICKLFSCVSKAIHGLLASKRRLIDL